MAKAPRYTTLAQEWPEARRQLEETIRDLAAALTSRLTIGENTTSRLVEVVSSHGPDGTAANTIRIKWDGAPPFGVVSCGVHDMTDGTAPSGAWVANWIYSNGFVEVQDMEHVAAVPNGPHRYRFLIIGG